MGWLRTALLAGAAEAAAHFLSLSWGFAVLVLAFVVTGLAQQLNTSRTMDLAKRHDALVVSVGGVKDTADYASGRADSAYTNAGNAQSTANSAQTAATNANNNANGRVSKSGDTMSGNLEVNTLTANWDVHVGNYLYCTDQSGALTCHGNVAVNGTLYPYGSIHGNFDMPWAPAPGQPPGGVTWNDSQLTNCVDSIISTLRNAGVYS